MINVIAVAKDYVPILKDKTKESDLYAYIKALRFLTIDIVEQKGTDPLREILSYMTTLLNVHKKSNSLRAIILEVLDNVYRQIDFEVQPEASLFDVQVCFCNFCNTHC